jgi:hypothetical protein
MNEEVIPFGTSLLVCHLYVSFTIKKSGYSKAY